MKRYNFKVRLTQGEAPISVLRVSGLALVSKPSYGNGICDHQSNRIKYGYEMHMNRSFATQAGTPAKPELSFGGSSITIEVRDFPRFPVFDVSSVRAKRQLEHGADPLPEYLNRLEIYDIEPVEAYQPAQILLP